MAGGFVQYSMHYTLTPITEYTFSNFFDETLSEYCEPILAMMRFGGGGVDGGGQYGLLPYST